MGFYRMGPQREHKHVDDSVAATIGTIPPVHRYFDRSIICNWLWNWFPKEEAQEMQTIFEIKGSHRLVDSGDHMRGQVKQIQCNSRYYSRQCLKARDISIARCVCSHCNLLSLRITANRLLDLSLPALPYLRVQKLTQLSQPPFKSVNPLSKAPFQKRQSL